jgi:hypothetical protein
MEVPGVLLVRLKTSLHISVHYTLCSGKETLIILIVGISHLLNLNFFKFRVGGLCLFDPPYWRPRTSC